MTAGGDEKKIETAKKHLTSAVIGAIIIVSAWVITYFVEETARKMITNSYLVNIVYLAFNEI